MRDVTEVEVITRRMRFSDGVCVIVSGFVTTWALGSWAFAGVGALLGACVLAQAARSAGRPVPVARRLLERPIAIGGRAGSAAQAEARRAVAVRDEVLAVVAGGSEAVRGLMSRAVHEVDGLARFAAQLADRDGALGNLEDRATLDGPRTRSPGEQNSGVREGLAEGAQSGGCEDPQAREDLEAARAASAEGARHAATIGTARARGRAQLTRVRCALEAVLAKMLCMQALEIAGDAYEAQVRRRELEGLSADVTASIEAVADTWGASVDADTRRKE